MNLISVKILRELLVIFLLQILNAFVSKFQVPNNWKIPRYLEKTSLNIKQSI